MNCPECRAILTKTTYESSSIYLCNQCLGVWVDGTELYIILGGTPELPEVKTREKKQCPKCENRSFYPIKYPGTDTIIDLCENCHGIWFGPGELKTIIEVIHNKSGTGESREFLSEKVSSWVNNTTCICT